MEIAVLNSGNNNLTNKEIETSVQALVFNCSATFTGSIVANTEGGAVKNPSSTRLTNDEILTFLLGGAELNIQKQDGSDTQSIIQSLRIKDLAEIAAHNEGVIKITQVDNLYTATFAIEVAKHAALALSDNAKLMLAISGLPAETTVIIDGLDHPETTHAYIKYEAKFVNANVGKDFNIDAAYALALPTDKIKALELTYANGKNVKMSQREIKQVLTDSQDPIYNRDGLVQFGFSSFAVLSVEHVVSMRVTLTDSVNFYLLKDQTI